MILNLSIIAQITKLTRSSSGFGNSPDSESVKSDQSRVDLLKRFLEALGVRAPVLLSPSMSGHYALPFLQRHSAQLHGFVPIAPVGTRGITPQQYRDIQVPYFFLIISHLGIP